MTNTARLKMIAKLGASAVDYMEIVPSAVGSLAPLHDASHWGWRLFDSVAREFGYAYDRAADRYVSAETR